MKQASSSFVGLIIVAAVGAILLLGILIGLNVSAEITLAIR